MHEEDAHSLYARTGAWQRVAELTLSTACLRLRWPDLAHHNCRLLAAQASLHVVP